MTPCPPPEVVQAAAAGVLSPPLATQVSAHVVDCAICLTLVEALDDPSTGNLTREERNRIRRRIQAGRAPGSTRLLRRIWRPAAAAALLGVTILIGWRWWNTLALSAPASSVLVPDSSPLISALSDPPNGSFGFTDEGSELMLALAPYRERDLAATVQNLADFVERHPGNAAGHFYLGVSSLLLHRDRLAVRALEEAERLAGGNNLPLARQSAWYLAIGYWRTGQLDRAQLRLTVLCGTRGELSERACAASMSLAFVTLSGTVRSLDGRPVDRATVGQYLVRIDGPQMILTPTSFASTSDTTGKYAVVGVPAVRGSHLVLRASKPGYFSASGGALLEPEMEVDFELRPWTIGTLDDVVSGTLDAAGDYCRNISELCRQLAVVAPRSGVLEVSLTTPAPLQMDVWVEGPDGDVHSPAVGAPLRVFRSAVAGATYQITVVSWVADSPPFELTMHLR